MVLQGEGRGNISSLYLVKYFGAKILPKWGGLILNGSLYNLSSILILSWMKKMEELAYNVHFRGRSQFGYLASRNF
jgi:hypothetical protein